MTKEEFLDEIKKELGFMPYEEVIKAEKYFESYFNGSEADEKVIERFGSPKYAAQNYYRTHVANSNAKNINTGFIDITNPKATIIDRTIDPTAIFIAEGFFMIFPTI